MSVNATIEALARAWNAGDGRGWASNFAADADFVDVVGRVQRGRDVIASEHQKIFDTIYRDSHLEIQLADSRRLGDDTVLVHTTSTLRVPAGPRAGTVHAIQTKIFQSGVIVAFHNTLLSDLADFVDRDEELASRSPQEWRRSRHSN